MHEANKSLASMEDSQSSEMTREFKKHQHQFYLNETIEYDAHPAIDNKTPNRDFVSRVLSNK